MTSKLNLKNVDALTKNKRKFFSYTKKIEKKFNGPSVYFYEKVINKIRETKNYSSLFENNDFIEDIYSTLASWGMHRMDKNTRMAEFEEFKNSIIKSKELFIQLSQKKIQTSNLEQSKDAILNIFNSLKIMRRDQAPKLVANSKIMHFLLPDLIPPIDKAHIYYFFYGRKNQKGRPPPKIKAENQVFWEILLQYQKIAKKLNLCKTDLKNRWDTSIPKLIDNAIIGLT